MNHLFDISGKVAVVTGGSRGIGAMIAKGFIEAGVKTYITARKLTELEATAAQLNTLGGAECVALASDLSTLQGLSAFADTLKSREAKIDILINNAGATWGEELSAFPEAGWDKVMDLNTKSPFFLLQQLLPLLREAGTQSDPARVINIGSINGLINPKMTNYSYSASKAALMHLSQHLAADLVGDYINVNCIAPGLFPSKMTAFAIAGNEDLVDASVPRGRIGNEDDAAGTAIYLCSKASSWVTGQTIVLDGGMVAVAG